jgi:UDP-hydrolysing UDP-N-acetyl-D-glucosamine 2-epimerase
MHFLKKYGFTINEIKADGFVKYKIVKMYDENKIDDTNYSKSLAKGIIGFASVFQKLKPDIVVVFGDRLESLAATLASSTLHIPIAHIHGGDKTDSGHIDESIRHAISQFAHIHFRATKEHSNRLLKMGQEFWRINQVGALGLDSIVGKKLIPKKELFDRLGLKLGVKTVVCLFHPVQLEIGKLGIQMNSILKALNGFDLQTVIIYPNNDSGSNEIISVIKKYRKEKRFKIFENLSHLEFLSLLKNSNVLIGNSSSGIIEAPSLRIPVINVGIRNEGRDCAENVKFVKNDDVQIQKYLKKSLYDTIFRRKALLCSNPYGKGNASEKIIRKLNNLKIDNELMKKKITI